MGRGESACVALRSELSHAVFVPDLVRWDAEDSGEMRIEVGLPQLA